MANNIVAIYAGRFHPFHKGHKAVYDSLVSKFGADKVFIATSGKQNDTDSPFSFKEKAAMMMLTGIPAKAISQEVSPYKPDNVLNNLPTDTAVVFAVGKKDMDENPRFKPGLKKDGTPTYYQPLDNKKVADLEGYEKHGYLIVAPTVKFTVLGQPATSASELRQRYAKLDDEQRGKFINDLFGNYDEVIQKVMDRRLAVNEVYDPEHGHDSDSHVVKHKDDNDQIFYGVYNHDGKIVRIFYDEDKAKEWTANAHDDLMNDRYVPAGETPEEEPMGKKIRPKTDKDDEPKSVNIDEFKVSQQSSAIKVLHNIEDRKSPFKVKYKNGTVTVSPKQARTFLNRYYQAGDDLKKELERKLSMFDYAKKWFRGDAKGYSSVITTERKMPEFGNRVYSGNEGIIVKQIKRLVKVVSDIENLNKEKPIDKDIMVKILSQLRQITNNVNDLKMKESVMGYIRTKESLYQLNRDDYLDSEVLISGLGRMTLRQAINRVKEYADEISRLMKQGDPFFIKGKLDHHADILQHYSKAVLDAYKDLGAIRKKGGVRSRNIPADVGERLQMKIDDIVLKENFDVVEGKAITEDEFDRLAEKQDACYHKVKSRYKVWPSAYASGALVQCRKVGAKNWGNKSKK